MPPVPRCNKALPARRTPVQYTDHSEKSRPNYFIVYSLANKTRFIPDEKSRPQVGPLHRQRAVASLSWGGVFVSVVTFSAPSTPACPPALHSSPKSLTIYCVRPYMK
ncbi:hypothetical protein J6590_024961 [Homalodisca vitripennis]|nr:hypothetical protein J6590_024961 [Homalodisca vitripennis]